VLSVLFATLGLVLSGATEGPSAGDLPLFVVERSRVIWPEKCQRGKSPAPPDMQSRIRKELGQRGLFVGDGRLDEVGFESPECMLGECGRGQFAVPLSVSESERYGIVIAAAGLDHSALRPLKLASIEGTDPDGLRPGLRPPTEAPPPCGAPPPEPTGSPGAGRLVTCLGYLERSGELGVQVQGRGQLQENGLGQYALVRFRMLERREGKLVPGQWHAQPRGHGTRLPVPVAVLPGKEMRVLWLRREGICCPSASSAWVTQVGAQVREGPRHVAGFGQPCD
jgi:hypothetical protein